MPTSRFSAQACRLASDCAVSSVDIVKFPAAGLAPEEILAGPLPCLPECVPLRRQYSYSLSRLAFCCKDAYLVVVKAEVDFIRNSFGGSGRSQNHCDDIAANPAQSAPRRNRCGCVADGQQTTFVGLDASENQYRTTRNRRHAMLSSARQLSAHFYRRPHRAGEELIPSREITQISSHARRSSASASHCEKGRSNVDDMKT